MISSGYVPYFTEINAALTPSYPAMETVRSLSVDATIRRMDESPFNQYDPGTISGTTRIAGDLIGGCQVLLIRDDTNELVATAVSASNGSFSFPGLNKAMKFTVVVKMAPGFEAYEYMVSSRRTPM